jgi:hypothetical protein
MIESIVRHKYKPNQKVWLYVPNNPLHPIKVKILGVDVSITDTGISHGYTVMVTPKQVFQFVDEKRLFLFKAQCRDLEILEIRHGLNKTKQ